MPETILLAIATAASTAATAAGASTAAALAIGAMAATAATTIATAAISVGLSLIASVLLRPKQPKPSETQIEIKQAIPPRSWPYGRVKTAGPLGFFESRHDGTKQTLFKIILISCREIDAYEQHFFHDDALTLGVDGWVDGYSASGIERARVLPYLGTDTQTAEPYMLASFPDPEWTTDHRLRGIAYVITAARAIGGDKFSGTFPNGPPEYKAIIRGAKVYDPRLDSTVSGGSGSHRHDDKATWEWSDNAALCTLDFLTHADGYKRPIAKLDIASFMAKADIDDELVPLKAGGTERRYRVATTVFLTEPRKAVLARLLEAGNAGLFLTADGTWRIAGGEWEAPTVTLDADKGHLIDATFANGVDALTRYNELAIQFMSPAHGYTETQGEAWRNEEDEDYIAGLIETRPLDLLQVPSHGQARRLAKIRMLRENPQWVGQVRANLYGLNCIGERLVNIVWQELEIDGPFWIDGVPTQASDDTVTLSVRSAREDSYDWDDEEEGDAPPVPEDTAGEYEAPEPPELADFTAERQDSGFWLFEWEPEPESPTVAATNGVNIRYAVGLTTDWGAMTLLNTTGLITTSPWVGSAVPVADNFYTFAARTVSTIEGETAEGPVKFFYVAPDGMIDLADADDEPALDSDGEPLFEAA